MIWGTESVRRDVDVLRDLMIDTPSGGQVPLGDIADVRDGFEDVDLRQRINGRESMSLTIYKVGQLRLKGELRLAVDIDPQSFY